ncbi:MAG: hypothetical protein PSX42_04860 [bacterium]|nr:hypothetical protein [bacterium]
MNTIHAHDLNPSIDKEELCLNMDTNNNALNLELAKSVGEYLHLNHYQNIGLAFTVKAIVLMLEV